MGTPVSSQSVRTCNCCLAWGWSGGTEPCDLRGLTLTAGGWGHRWTESWTPSRCGGIGELGFI